MSLRASANNKLPQYCFQLHGFATYTRSQLIDFIHPFCFLGMYHFYSLSSFAIMMISITVLPGLPN